MTYVVDLIGQVVEAMRDASAPKPWAPEYMYGHRLEINNQLKLKNNDSEKKFQKYPLVALNQDFPEKVEGGLIKLKLNIVIVESTEKEYNSAERYANVFKPVLYPLLDSFFEQLKNSGLFTWDSGEELPDHTKYDRPFWGIANKEGNEVNIFSDPLDAIELVDLEINCRNKNC